ncbi:MAG: hypothetical protein JEZ03_10780 [Bacteroidales bacterium]|nr:hypothetical protein [Bacteroidales bacterium]
MNQAFQLYQLQKTDTRIDKINNRLKEINLALADKKIFLDAEANFKTMKLTLDKKRRNMIAAGEETKSLSLKLERNKATLYSGTVKNPKELEDLQSESTSLQNRLSQLEDSELEAMFAVEEAEKDQNNSAIALKDAESELATQHALLRGEKGTLEQQLVKYNSEKQAIMGSVSNESVSIYINLRKTKRGLAVVKVDDDACSVCGSILTPAERQMTKSPNRIIYCSTCGRIMYAG